MNIAYIQCGELGGPYRTVMADGVRVYTDTPRNPYIAGYGAAIPTPYMVLYRGYWRRVYCSCYGNSFGSPYVRVKGLDTKVDLYID